MKEVKEYFDNGFLEKVCYIDNENRICGLYKRYWDNGNIFLKTPYNKGNQQGVQVSFLKNRERCAIISYRKWTFNGVFIQFYY